jgi:rod shape determining protein RodA
MFILAQIPPNKYRFWAPWFFSTSLFLLLTVLIAGHIGKGAERWLNLGLFKFQPSELMKIAMPMMLAWYFTDKPLPPTKIQLLTAAALMSIPTILIAKQPDLGTALLIFASGCCVLLLAGISWRMIGSFFAISIATMPIVWHFMRDYQRERVLTFLNPARDPLGAGYHIIQSKIAIGSGGMFGKGWLQGSQSHLQFLPEHATDFIFAVCGEEFGLFGVMILLSIYLFIVARCLMIAANAQDTFTRLLAGSLGLTFFMSVFINVGMVTGVLPVVGLPLPLVSYGGTSVVTVLAAFGIIMSIQTHRNLVSR